MNLILYLCKTKFKHNMRETREKPTMRDKKLFRLASMKRNIRIHVPGFAFKHDGDIKGKDTFVGRDVQSRRLFMWLTSQSKSGSYLVTGYRGMGKSLLVKKVMRMIIREPHAYKETLFQASMFLCLLFFFLHTHCGFTNWFVFSLLILSFAIAVALYINKIYYKLNFDWKTLKIPNHHLFDREIINKTYWSKNDKRHRENHRINISVNLGQESLSEHDVLSILAQSIRDKYSQYVHDRQNRPLASFVMMFVLFFIGSFVAEYIVRPFFIYLLYDIKGLVDSLNELCDCATPNLWSVTVNISNDVFNAFCHYPVVRYFAWFLIFSLTILLTYKIISAILKHVYMVSVPSKAIKRLNILIDRINAAVSEESGTASLTSHSFFSVSFLNNNRKKVHPMANVREIESELMNIVNLINSNDCPSLYRVQFILVFDELDKITKSSGRNLALIDKENKSVLHEDSPEFETSVKGFTDAMAYEERKQNVLRLLANMKLFITSTKAKFVFISGHELYDASLADLSDREFAINNIFDRILNVNSFLSPERGESDVSSLTERYIATMLLPSEYLAEKMNSNARQHDMLKEELPSLRWFNEYLIETHILKNTKNFLDEEEIKHKEDEIRYVIEFLHYFTVYLAHVCNGSPKKITIYFEKYIKLYYDVEQNVEWCDEITMGAPDNPKDLREQCVLYFNATDQKLISFIHYIAYPVINAITNEVSNYGDKLLVSSSFILDQIYKYHGRVFSWRNFEQMPELLNPNKDAELRDAMLSIIEFLLQVHITTVTSGLFNYKFHKQISEEISYLSKISEDASAIFNFTLNESETVKRYNILLLNHYVNLTKDIRDQKYSEVIERIHENLGDLCFSDEDYYRAVHEYKSALKYILTDDKREITPQNVLQYLRCNLKVGLAYEYRRTYSNAYMVYCNIINRLVHLRWIDVDKLGLDFTMRRTSDWRNKQSVLINKMPHKSDTFHSQFNPGLYEDGTGQGGRNPEYSLDSEKSITGFSQRMTPEKSDAILHLTTFEEIAFIYQAILAKLFVIEKMDVSGITQSSIDQAEAEFTTLHRFVNIEDKFFISADFFEKMGEILYYKNSTVSSFKPGTLADALYRYAFINVLSMVDDFCYVYCKNVENAITIKQEIFDFFNTLKLENNLNEESDFSFENLGNSTEKDKSPHINAYLQYLDRHIGYLYAKEKIKEIPKNVVPCAQRYKVLKELGIGIPCHACQYTTRSLDILIKHLLGEAINNNFSKAHFLLFKLEPNKLLYARKNQITLLASASEEFANIMLSCSFTSFKNIKCDCIKDSTIKLLLKYIEVILKGNELKESQELDVLTEQNNRELKDGKSNLDRAILYYFAAYKFYNAAVKYKEAAFCIGRVIKVFEDYLKVQQFFIQYKGENTADLSNCDNMVELLENLFLLAARTQSWQFDGLTQTEIHEYKWILHLTIVDKIDLAKLTVFPELQSIFLSVLNCKLLYYKINQQTRHNDYINYLSTIYTRISPAFQHNKTFRGEVEAYYNKAYVNNLVLCHLLNADNPIMDNKYRENFDYKIPFCKHLLRFLTSDNVQDKVLIDLLKCDSSCESKLNIIEFLVHDSLVALSYVLKIFTPHNHITTFSNSFVAEVYDLLWEHSKYFEMLDNIYRFYKNIIQNECEANKLLLNSMNGITNPNIGELKKLMTDISDVMENNDIVSIDRFGYKYNKLYNNLRHEIDDFSIKHTNTNYSAEMAIKYYTAARNINTEGAEYKNMISSMYILDDDLRNDTCQGNLADERYLMNCGVWDTKLRWYRNLYSKSAIITIKPYESGPKQHLPTYSSLGERFEDSEYTNTEY